MKNKKHVMPKDDLDLFIYSIFFSKKRKKKEIIKIDVKSWIDSQVKLIFFV